MIWDKNTIKTEALKYKTRKEFQKNAPGALDAAKRLDIYDEVCVHMEWINKRWTDEELFAEALKYGTRNDFFTNKAYHVARNRGILDKICQHMPKDLKMNNFPHNKKWNEEAVAKEALKYFFRSDFKKNNEGAYDAAKDMKILDKICSHMNMSRNSSKHENHLFDKIKQLYPSAQKLRDRNAKIPNKPHIKGFDIDIYIPELRKGIEFDGTYWHSFEVMRKNKNRSLWSDEDVKNYHKIKDDYFLSKGVKILHINDKEWLQNKTQSLDRILNFLKVS